MVVDEIVGATANFVSFPVTVAELPRVCEIKVANPGHQGEDAEYPASIPNRRRSPKLEFVLDRGISICLDELLVELYAFDSSYAILDRLQLAVAWKTAETRVGGTFCRS